MADSTAEHTGAAPTGLAAVFGPTINAIFAPQKAFEALRARPLLAIWPAVWVMVGAAIAGWMNVDITRQTMRIGTIESMQQRGQEMDPEQLRQMLEGMDRFAPIFATAGNLFLVLFIAIFAVMFWVGASLSGGSTTFSRAFGVAAIGAVIAPLVSLWFVSLMWYFDPPEFRRMAEFFAATPSLGLDLFFGDDISVPLRTALQRVDVFNAWWIYVTALGCGTLLEVKGAARWGIPIGIWALSAAITVAWASLGT